MNKAKIQETINLFKTRIEEINLETEKLVAEGREKNQDKINNNIETIKSYYHKIQEAENFL